MLVRVSYFETDGLPQPFNEEETKKHQESKEEEWAEFLVVWRRRHLELYEEWVRRFHMTVAYSLTTYSGLVGARNETNQASKASCLSGPASETPYTHLYVLLGGRFVLPHSTKHAALSSSDLRARQSVQTCRL